MGWGHDRNSNWDAIVAMSNFRQFWATILKCPVVRNDATGQMIVQTRDGAAVIVFDERRLAHDGFSAKSLAGWCCDHDDSGCDSCG